MTARLMSWALFLLVRLPEALAKLRSEIELVTEGSHELSRAKISKMNYLRCVINESQRLYPQRPVNIRAATKTTFLPSGGGLDRRFPVLIPKGTGVGYSFYHMHRLKSSYEEFALAEASCAIVRTIQTFPELRLPPEPPSVPPGEEKQALTFVAMSAEGCKVLLE
ncbi:Cytochrome P450 E-class CYP52 [Penicillium concentricum]|uniref:Cytochrome P450 E-class CYP52 n=1 Tax=Penicillium concentricum TaxID=293559 RepID=A0A9W9RUB7_9EURO|nr:Cytochrome P450 E-class CYP52 [Penicillium concentricum]KAJ5365790.1 Cytochrome P450 E-class CYP52 [Penicillium concentricum]